MSDNAAVNENPSGATGFDDLLEANRVYATTDFATGGFDGIAHAGVAIVTCMDSRIDPLRMLGLRLQPDDFLDQIAEALIARGWSAAA